MPGGDSSGFAVKAQILTLTTADPTDIALSSTVISETAQEGGPLAVLSTTGALNSAFQYTIISDSSGGAFGIVGDRLVVLDNSLLDFETAPQVQLRIRTTDENNHSFEETIQLTLSDVPETDYAPEGNEFLLNTTTEGNQGWALLTELTSGGYLAQWSDWPLSGSGGAQKGQIFDSGGNKVGGEILVPGEAAAALPGGGFITTWMAYTGQANNYDIRAQIHDASGSPVGPVIEANTNVLGYQVNPAVATFASGGFMITWMSSLNGKSARATASFSTPRSKLGHPPGQTYPGGGRDATSIGHIVVVGRSACSRADVQPDGFRFERSSRSTRGFQLIEPRSRRSRGGFAGCTAVTMRLTATATPRGEGRPRSWSRATVRPGGVERYSGPPGAASSSPGAAPRTIIRRPTTPASGPRCSIPPARRSARSWPSTKRLSTTSGRPKWWCCRRATSSSAGPT